MIYSFIVGEKTHGHIIWNEESQYYIFEYELKEGNIGIKLYYCNDICYKDTISNNAFDINKMTLVSNEERVFWNWAEETFNNIESFYDKENVDIVKLNRPIEIEEKIKFFLSKKYDFMFPKEFVDYLKKYNDSRLDNNVIEDFEYGVIS